MSKLSHNIRLHVWLAADTSGEDDWNSDPMFYILPYYNVTYLFRFVI
jgi:hypothetical protein